MQENLNNNYIDNNIEYDKFIILSGSLRNFSSLSYFFIKKIFRSYTFYLTLFLIFIIDIAVGSQLSFSTSFAAVSSTSITTIVLINYGFLYFTVKQTTLANLFNQKYSFALIMISIFFVVFFVTIITYLILLAFSWLLFSNDFIVATTDNIGSLNDESLNRSIIFSPFKDGKFFVDFYYIFMLILVNLSFAFFMQSIFKNKKQFYFFSMSYIVLIVIFGGIYSAVFKLDPTLINNGVTPLYHLNQNGEWIIYPYANRETFNPGFLWYFSQFFPVYPLNQFNYYCFSKITIYPGSTFDNLVHIYASQRGISVSDEITVIPQYFTFYDPYSKYFFSMPYVWITLLLTGGFFMSRKKLSKK